MTIISLGKQYAYMFRFLQAKGIYLPILAPMGACAYLTISTGGSYVFLYIVDTFKGYIPDTTPLYSVDFYYLQEPLQKLLASYLRPYKNKISKEYWRFL